MVDSTQRADWKNGTSGRSGAESRKHPNVRHTAAQRQPDLQAGGEVEAETREQERSRAHAIVMRQLAMMDRSRAQLADALRRRDVQEQIAEETLDHFESIGLIDDAHFAQVLTRSRFAARGASRRAIREELRRKGVDGDLAERALSAIGEEEEDAAAVELALRKLRAGTGNPQTLRRRVYATLARRGFSAEQCTNALRQAEARLASEGGSACEDGLG